MSETKPPLSVCLADLDDEQESAWQEQDKRDVMLALMAAHALDPGHTPEVEVLLVRRNGKQVYAGWMSVGKVLDGVGAPQIVRRNIAEYARYEKASALAAAWQWELAPEDSRANILARHTDGRFSAMLQMLRRDGGARFGTYKGWMPSDKSRATKEKRKRRREK